MAFQHNSRNEDSLVIGTSIETDPINADVAYFCCKMAGQSRHHLDDK